MVFKNIKTVLRQAQIIRRIFNILYSRHSNTPNNQIELLSISTLEELKNLIFEGGSVYIKLMQWYISKLRHSDTNNSHISPEIITQLTEYFEDIFEDCPYHDIEYTKEIFKLDRGISLDAYIDINTLKPIASGSIGQVYYAKRKLFGTDIAIKVKHPNIDNDVKDGQYIISFIKWLQSIPYFKRKYNLCFDFQDFIESINMQIDFTNEHQNNTILRHNFKKSRNCVVFPEVIFSSRNILISEYIPAVDVNTLSTYQQQQSAINLVCFMHQMVQIDNFIHGDLHHKNWKVAMRNDEFGVERSILVIYDCGICFKSPSIEMTREFWDALESSDLTELGNLVKKFVIGDKNMTPSCQIELDTFVSDVRKHSLTTQLIMRRILGIFANNNIVVDKFLLNLIILLCLLENFLKKNNFLKTANDNLDIMQIIKETRLDITTFCSVRNSYLEVSTLMQEKIDKDNKKIKPQLFASIGTSGFKFKPII